MSNALYKIYTSVVYLLQREYYRIASQSMFESGAKAFSCRKHHNPCPTLWLSEDQSTSFHVSLSPPRLLADFLYAGNDQPRQKGGVVQCTDNYDNDPVAVA